MAHILQVTHGLLAEMAHEFRGGPVEQHRRRLAAAGYIALLGAAGAEFLQGASAGVVDVGLVRLDAFELVVYLLGPQNNGVGVVGNLLPWEWGNPLRYKVCRPLGGVAVEHTELYCVSRHGPEADRAELRAPRPHPRLEGPAAGGPQHADGVVVLAVRRLVDQLVVHVGGDLKRSRHPIVLPVALNMFVGKLLLCCVGTRLCGEPTQHWCLARLHLFSFQLILLIHGGEVEKKIITDLLIVSSFVCRLKGLLSEATPPHFQLLLH
mmetsp:Transcript_53101/g.151288  ORF Transcript_53101/g.151288 Transcript_53101/m.151288 type:complete len:265 (+) Transcript_53101:966-1760(+)